MYGFKTTSKFHGCQGWVYKKDEDAGTCRMVFTKISKKVKTQMVQAVSNSPLPKMKKEAMMVEIERMRQTKQKNIMLSELVRLNSEPVSETVVVTDSIEPNVWPDTLKGAVASTISTPSRKLSPKKTGDKPAVKPLTPEKDNGIIQPDNNNEEYEGTDKAA